MKRKSRKTRRSASKKGFGFGSIKKAADFSVKLPGLLIISEFFYDEIIQLWSLLMSLLSI